MARLDYILNGYGSMNETTKDAKAIGKSIKIQWCLKNGLTIISQAKAKYKN